MSAGEIVRDRAVAASVAAFLVDASEASTTVFKAEAGGDGALWHFAESRYRAVVKAATKALGEPSFEVARTKGLEGAPEAIAANWSRATLWETDGNAVVATLSGSPGKPLEVGLCRGPWP